jgi:hypothetical protein
MTVPECRHIEQANPSTSLYIENSYRQFPHSSNRNARFGNRIVDDWVQRLAVHLSPPGVPGFARSAPRSLLLNIVLPPGLFGLLFVVVDDTSWLRACPCHDVAYSCVHSYWLHHRGRCGSCLVASCETCCIFDSQHSELGEICHSPMEIASVYMPNLFHAAWSFCSWRWSGQTVPYHCRTLRPGLAREKCDLRSFLPMMYSCVKSRERSRLKIP